MNSPLFRSISSFGDANRTLSASLAAAKAHWSDAAQRSFWSHIVEQIEREARQYEAALRDLDESLRKALRLMDS